MRTLTGGARPSLPTPTGPGAVPVHEVGGGKSAAVVGAAAHQPGLLRCPKHGWSAEPTLTQKYIGSHRAVLASARPPNAPIGPPRCPAPPPAGPRPCRTGWPSATPSPRTQRRPEAPPTASADESAEPRSGCCAGLTNQGPAGGARKYSLQTSCCRSRYLAAVFNGATAPSRALQRQPGKELIDLLRKSGRED